MPLRLPLKVNETVYVGDITVTGITAQYIGTANPKVSIEVIHNEKVQYFDLTPKVDEEVFPEVFVGLSPKGSGVQEKFQLLFTAPKEMKITRDWNND